MNDRTLKSVRTLLLAAALAVGMWLPRVASAAGVPVDGFLPQVGITLTDEFVHDLEFFPQASAQPGGNFLGNGSAHYSVALLDTGAAVSLITTDSDNDFNIDGPYTGQSDGFRGTEPITIGGASGFLEASVGDPLGLYAGGLHLRTGSGPVLTMNSTGMRGQTHTSIVTIPPESDLPNVLGLPFASQYTTRILNSQPQVFQVAGETVRSPAIDFQPLGSGGLGITRKAQLKLLGDSPSTPLLVINLGDFDIDHPYENPSQPTVVQGGHFLDATFSNDVGTGGGSFSSDFFFDTGASVTVVSQFKALELGYDVTLDEPEFTIAIVGSGGVLNDVPGFFIDQITIPALGGSLVVNQAPVIVLDVTNPADPGNIVDGIIGTNLFQGRDIVIDPNPSLGGGGPSAGLYISDPVTTVLNWSTASTNGNWTTLGNWGIPEVPGLLTIANVRHVSGGDQQANLTGGAEAFEVNISSSTPGSTMTLALGVGSHLTTQLTTFSGTNIEAGGVLLLDNATLDTQYVDIRDAGRLTGDGSIRTGSGTLPGQVENVSGIVAPGNGIGMLEIEGRLANSPGGILQFELGDSQHDQIVIDGTVALAGTLEVTLDAGYQPSLFDSYTIIDSTEGVGGMFETLTLPQGYNWKVDYNAMSVVLSVGLPGDFNHDMTVDALDYTVWRDGLGSLYTIADYLTWKNNFGTSAPAGSFATHSAVPEPATVWLLALGVAGVARLRAMQS